jgi:hypothetical protein
MPVRRYRFLPGHVHFEAGRTARGQQVLLAHNVTDIAVFLFSRAGTYRGCEAVPMTVPARWDRRKGAYVGIDDAYWQRVREEVQKVKERLGFVEGAVEVRRFSEGRFHARIDDLPDEYEQFLECPEDEDADERAEMEAAVARWRKQKNFVWVFWGIQHWMSANGEVLSHD